MIECIETFRVILMKCCLAALGLSVAALFGFAVAKGWRTLYPKMHALSRLERSMLAFMLVICTLYGGTKAVKPSFNFDDGLRNDGSYATNDLVHVEWVKTGTPYVPDAATLYVDFREIGSTNEWKELAQGTVGDYRLDIALVNATNYNFNIWWYYESADVHTNGVWKYTTISAKGNDASETDELKALPRRALTEGDGKAIATPGLKPKED